MAFKKRDNRLNGLNPLAYMGVEPVSPPGSFQINRAPTVNDLNYDVGDIWIDSVTLNIYMLVSTAADPVTKLRTATWVLLSTGVTGVTDVITDDGNDVAPVGGVINLLTAGSPLISTTGAGNTATINLNTSPLCSQFTADDLSTIVPVAGNIVVHGEGVLTTSTTPFNELDIRIDDGGLGALIIGGGGAGATWADLTSDGSIVFTPGVNSLKLTATSGSGGKITIYHAPGAWVWTKDPRSMTITVIGWSGGGGGGSGSRYTSPGTAYPKGGGGGSGGGGFMVTSPSFCFGNTENVVVGAGGAGGPANDFRSSGFDGSPGGTTSFGYLVSTPTFNFGGGGSAVSTDEIFGGYAEAFYTNYASMNLRFDYPSNTPPFSFQYGPQGIPCSPYGGGSIFNQDGSVAYWRYDGTVARHTGDVPTLCGCIPGSGGGGGAFHMYPAVPPPTGAKAGGRGSNIVQTYDNNWLDAIDSGTVLIQGGVGGAAGVDGAPGSNQLLTGGILTGGSGGGGGGAAPKLGIAGSGGRGGWPGGGGGGGGAAPDDTITTGAGGNGGDGAVIVIEVFGATAVFIP